MNGTIYLDNNASAPLAPAVLAAMLECLRDCCGNPSSRHRAGSAAKERLATARGQVAALIGATPPEIVFTGSATEANHMAILGALTLSAGRRHIVASAVEHPSTLLLLRHLQASGVRVSLIGVDAQGRLDLDQLAAAILPDTALVSLMWANNETGVIFPVAEAAGLAKSRGVLFHTDAVQAAGRVAIDVKQAPVDLLSIAGHKLHAAKGIGALYVRKGVKLPPLLFGHQERGRRGGTENVAAAVGMGVAADLAAQTLLTDAVGVAALRDRLERGLLARLPLAKLNAAQAPRLPNTSSVRLGEIDSEIVLDCLDRAGICASSGSACTAGGTMPSHVLLAMGLSSDEALATIRFSLSRYNRAEEIDAVLETLAAIVPSLASLA
jgi:cysteine desulfurase